jgi:hypothetical protein
MTTMPLLQFAGNEVYASNDGLTIWMLNATYTSTNHNAAPSTVKDFHVWNTPTGFFGYPVNKLTLDGYVVREDASLLTNPNDFSAGIVGGNVDYLTANFVLQNSDIQGADYGVMVPPKVGDTSDTGQTPITYTIQNTYLRNYYNIEVETMGAVTGGGVLLSPRVTVVRNVTFDRVNMTDRSGDPQLNIWMAYDYAGRANRDFIQSDKFYVYAFNGNTSDNFQVFYTAQVASFIVPQTGLDAVAGTDAVGSPVAGLTNQQNWNQFGIAIAGEIAPASATSRPGIVGLVNPI